ncbi:hypothetical protein NI17_019370 [Thermobifida halotolerans]|uniref:Uncharacterized protein n=1 Tax=Thermobifida halotolerans TaxID=483545 RepID=A0A399FWA6_9ACTN|nr:hypothetical protein [Thermobifida halotolerans]UOE18907.1 hypothetical protein NI17_019370 [Thermobifida halotolerans]
MTDAAASPTASRAERPLAIITAPDGATRELAPGMRLCFGRSQHNDLVIPDSKLSLSRFAGEIAAEAGGVRVTNRSQTHLLRIVMGTGVNTLPPAKDKTPAASLIVNTGTVLVGSPGMHTENRMLQVTVVSTASGTPPPTPLPAPEEASTVGPWEMNTATRYFAVALVLCRNRLENSAESGRDPSAKQIAHAILELTSAHHLLNRIDAGDLNESNRLTQRIRDHLKYLMTRLGETGQVPENVRLNKQSLAHYLVALEILRRDHLKLLTDPEWLSVQERLWWDE